MKEINTNSLPVLKTQPSRLPKPKWIRIKPPSGQKYKQTRAIVQQHKLHTICEEALCPNISECWQHGTATFLLMGDLCTRKCRFCAVKGGLPDPLDPEEPDRIAQAVEKMDLKHVVLTSVNRDDLPDGGADHFVKTVLAIKQRLPLCTIETLIPDLDGNWDALSHLIDSKMTVLNHNIETVLRMYPFVRPQAVYSRSLELLDRARDMNPNLMTKSGLMVGLGEEKNEILEVMSDLHDVGCSILTIGQYLQPSPDHYPVIRYVEPHEFDEYSAEGRRMGFKQVESAPFVRSSYHAWKQVL